MAKKALKKSDSHSLSSEAQKEVDALSPTESMAIAQTMEWVANMIAERVKLSPETVAELAVLRVRNTQYLREVLFQKASAERAAKKADN